MPIPKRPEMVYDKLVEGGEFVFQVVRCKQRMACIENYDPYAYCATEFTSKRFNLGTCLVWPHLNVPISKVINLKAGEKRLELNEENAMDLSPYDYVFCGFCDTHVGVIYEGSVALMMFQTTLHPEDFIFDALYHEVPRGRDQREILSNLLLDPQFEHAVNCDVFSRANLRFVAESYLHDEIMNKSRIRTRRLRMIETQKEKNKSNIPPRKIYYRYANFTWVSNFYFCFLIILKKNSYLCFLFIETCI